MSILSLGAMCLAVGVVYIIGVPVGGLSMVKFGRWHSNQTGAPNDEEWEGFLLISGALCSWFSFILIGVAVALLLLDQAQEKSKEIVQRIP